MTEAKRIVPSGTSIDEVYGSCSGIRGTRVEVIDNGTRIVEPPLVIPESFYKRDNPIRKAKVQSSKMQRSDPFQSASKSDTDVKEFGFFSGKIEAKKPKTRKLKGSDELCRKLSMEDDSANSDSSDEVFARSSLPDSVTSSTHSCHDWVDITGEIDRHAIPKLCVVLVISLAFMILEYLGAYYSSSMSIFLIASHLACDIVGFIVSILALHLTKKPPSISLSYGYYRAEVLGSLASLVLVWLISGFVIYGSARRLGQESVKINAHIMVISAGLGFLVNTLIVFILHGSHCNGYFHGTEKKGIPKKYGINVMSAFLHSVSDIAMSGSMFCVSLFIKYHEADAYLDPILAAIWSVLSVIMSFTVLNDIAHILMEGCPKNIDYVSLFDDLEGIPGVRTVHNLHVWSLSPSKCALAVHVSIDSRFDSQAILVSAQSLLKRKHNFFRVTIQVELYHRDMDFCVECQLPDVLADEALHSDNSKYFLNTSLIGFY